MGKKEGRERRKGERGGREREEEGRERGGREREEEATSDTRSLFSTLFCRSGDSLRSTLCSQNSRREKGGNEVSCVR